MVVGGKKKTIEPIPALDHSQTKYPDFEKCFYTENEDISLMTEEEVDAFRRELGMQLISSLFPPLYYPLTLSIRDQDHWS